MEGRETRRTTASTKYRAAAAAHRRAKRNARPRATSRVQRSVTARRVAVMLRNQCASRRPSSVRDQQQRPASNRETAPSNRRDAAATMRDLRATRCARPAPIDRAAAREAARTSRPPCAASAHGIARPARGITDSACKNQLVVVSIQYGPFNPYIPIRSTTIGKSRVAIDPIAMHTSWRSNSDITSVTRVSMAFRVVRTNQYNQDLGLVHSTNGNHLESPNDGSSIDHQVTIHLHAQNITIFPTNETWTINQLRTVNHLGAVDQLSAVNQLGVVNQLSTVKQLGAINQLRTVNYLGMVKLAQDVQTNSVWSNQLRMVKPAQGRSDQLRLVKLARGKSNQLGKVRPAGGGQTSWGSSKQLGTVNTV
ncbi:hypothetical protein F511_36764 [Dorcoceras hygrometricum]|uniref:Uncharacterized protein n=1 Tax=Dorcoceras hygrometricum TaxID=472368 RepID=A0A2Z7ANW2_9LAMI|nr:hypothetical protein F511_36764 [Dorcoceras hygrometricum]